MAALGQAQLSWKLGSGHPVTCPGPWPSTIDLGAGAETSGLADLHPSVSPSEAGLPFMSMPGVTSSYKAHQDLDRMGAFLVTWLNTALLV